MKDEGSRRVLPSSAAKLYLDLNGNPTIVQPSPTCAIPGNPCIWDLVSHGLGMGHEDILPQLFQLPEL
jgi:hypothetical protein